MVKAVTTPLITKITQTTWIRLSDKVIIPAGTILFEENSLKMGGRTYPLNSVRAYNCDELLDDNISLELEPTELRCKHAIWQLDVLMALRPAIFWTVFGKSDLFRMARISLASLQKESGLKSTNILVTAREDRGRLQSTFFDSCVKFDRVIFHEAKSVSEFAFSRYSIFLSDKGFMWRNYCPLIYLDCDVMCDGPLTELCVSALCSNKILLTPEGLANDPKDWFGNSLMKLDSSLLVADGAAGYNSGVIVSRNGKELIEFCKHVIELKTSLESIDQKLISFFDQPLVNYLGRKLDVIDIEVLSKVVRLSGLASIANKSKASGLIHFAGGVGNSTPKIARMVQYANSLGYS